jgi:predicted alpha/beta-fold hydrolase
MTKLTSKHALEKLKAATSSIAPCISPSWANTGHLQTMLGHLLPSPGIDAEGEIHFIALESETETERLHATFFKGKKDILVYVFHGLGGDSGADYMRRTARVARKLGYSVLLVNHRGCGPGKGMAKESYHSGRGEDLSSVIAYGKKLYPNHLHVAIGFSLSANALLLLAAGYRGTVPPDVAIAVNGPIDLTHASEKLSSGLNRIYDFRFVLQLKRYLKDNRPGIGPSLRGIKDLRTFDEQYTAPFGGFKNRNDYYERCSALPHLKNISIPTVMLTALDDPFVMGADYESATLSPQVHLHLEKSGGHMGYLAKKGLGYYRWLDHALEVYLKALST